jgi:sulfur carrier protein ThiS
VRIHREKKLQIKVVLFSIFREKLPAEAHGKTTLDLPERSTIDDLLARLDIQIHAVCALNGQIERDFSKTLQDGDEIQVFRPIGGG